VTESPPAKPATSARKLAYTALKAVHQGAYADVALHRALSRNSLGDNDRHLTTELVYGSVRRQRTLDALLDQLGTKPAAQQPIELRVIVHLGLYQLRYLNQIPDSAAVHTAVELTKSLNLGKLAGVVNGMLRQYLRQQNSQNSREQNSQNSRQQDSQADPLQVPADPVAALGIRHSYPDWIVATWIEALGIEETAALCEWLNHPPAIDLRVHKRCTTVAAVTDAFADADIAIEPLPHLPQGLRLVGHGGNIRHLPGYDEGWWTVQDASAQLVSYLVDPQPGQTVIDACAAPGGKAAHMADLMGDTGVIWACDRTPSRLKKVTQTIHRLGLTSLRTHVGDSTTMTRFQGQGDRVLVDAPCSGLGTLHRHGDARWRQTPDTVQELAALQAQLLDQAATWVKPDGTLVYATCTLHPAENEDQIQRFLETHPSWAIVPPAAGSPVAPYVLPEGWIKVWPHRHHQDGFFMVRLAQQSSAPTT
jgi:16S rRNA (cytosine967-C5)-methyltransferase